MSSPISPVKVSDLNFIPELFFDLIARVIPGYFVLGFAYLYIEIFTQPPYTPCNCQVNNIINIASKIPMWSTPIIAYYLAVLLCILSRKKDSKLDKDIEETAQKLDKDIEETAQKLYRLTHNAPEDRGRFQKLFAEFDATSSISMGLSIIFVSAFFGFLIVCFVKNTSLKPIFTLPLILLFIINIFFMYSINLWKTRLRDILKERLDSYAEYKNLSLRENWVKNFNSLARNNQNKVKRFDVFEDDKKRRFLIISPDEINDFSNQILAVLSTNEEKDYPTRIDCEVIEDNEVKQVHQTSGVISNNEVKQIDEVIKEDKKLEKIKFAFDQFHIIKKRNLAKKFGQVIQGDRSKVLDILAKMFA